MRRFVTVMATAVVAIVLGATQATGDPNLDVRGVPVSGAELPHFRDLVVVGGETTQYLVDSIAKGYDNGFPRLASFNAVKPGTEGGSPVTYDPIVLRDPDQFPESGDEVIRPRPPTTEQGITELTRSPYPELRANVVRSVRAPVRATRDVNFAFIQFASDVLTYATDDATFVPHDLTADNLRAIYTCGRPDLHPKLPPPGSDQRARFLQGIGLTEYQAAEAVNSGCVEDHVYLDNDRAAVDGDAFALMPFSTARYLVHPPDENNPPYSNIVLASEFGPRAFAMQHDVYLVISLWDQTEETQAILGPDGPFCAALADGFEQGFTGIGARCGWPAPIF